MSIIKSMHNNKNDSSSNTNEKREDLDRKLVFW